MTTTPTPDDTETRLVEALRSHGWDDEAAIATALAPTVALIVADAVTAARSESERAHQRARQSEQRSDNLRAVLARVEALLAADDPRRVHILAADLRAALMSGDPS